MGSSVAHPTKGGVKGGNKIRERVEKVLLNIRPSLQ
jgi:hypothetical protein